MFNTPHDRFIDRASHRAWFAFAFAFAGSLVLAGCGKDDAANDDSPAKDEAAANKAQTGPADRASEPTDTSGTKAPEPSEPAQPAGPRGLQATDNNPALVEFAAPMANCKIDAMYPTNSCLDEVRAFIAAFDPDKDLPTLINFTEDPGVAVRFLAARVLGDKMLMQLRPTREYAARVLTSAEAETDVATAKVLGAVLLQGDFEDTDYADRVAKIFETHALAEMRAAVASNLAAQDPEHFIPLLQTQFAAETDKQVKLAIVGGFYTTRGVCEWNLSVMDDEDNDIAAKAAYNIAWTSGKCKDHYDAFNAKYAARVERGKVDFNYVLLTNYMARADGATAAQKAAFLEAAKGVVENTEISGMTRASVLEVIGEHAKDGKAYAKPFRDDPDGSVAAAAKKIK